MRSNCVTVNSRHDRVAFEVGYILLLPLGTRRASLEHRPQQRGYRGIAAHFGEG
jgi:hypothetical protein